MDDVLHWLFVAMAVGALGYGLYGFYRGLSLSENEHRLDRTSGDSL